MGKTRLNLGVDQDVRIILKKYIPNLSQFINELGHKVITMDKNFDKEWIRVIKTMKEVGMNSCKLCKEEDVDFNDMLGMSFTKRAVADFSKDNEKIIEPFTNFMCKGCYDKPAGDMEQTIREVVDQSNKQQEEPVVIVRTLAKMSSLFAEVIIYDKIMKESDNQLKNIKLPREC